MSDQHINEQTQVDVKDLALVLVLAEFTLYVGKNQLPQVVTDTVNEMKAHLVKNHWEESKSAFEYWKEQFQET